MNRPATASLSLFFWHSGPARQASINSWSGDLLGTALLMGCLALACAPVVLHASTTTDSLAGVRAPCVDFRSGESFSIGAQHVLGDGRLATQWNPASTPLCLGSALEVTSVSLRDGTGGALVVWVDTRSGESDLFAQRVTASGSIAPGWSGDGVPVCVARGYQDRVALAPDGAGGVIVVWQDYRRGSYGTIFAQRLSAAGMALWTPDGVAVSTDSCDQAAPALVPDGNGGALVVWQDDRAGDYDLRWVRVDANGGVGPAPGGTPLVDAPGDQRVARLVADGAGAVTVIWEDCRASGTQLRAAAFSVSVPPTLSGPGAGSVVAADVGNDPTTTTTSDGVGGVYVAWSPRIAGLNTVRLQRINPQGLPAYADSGLVICGGIHEKYGPALCPDGTGGCNVAWEDFRDGTADIFAQRLTGDGLPAWAPDGIPLCAADGEQYGVALRPDGSGGAFATWSDNTVSTRAAFLRARPSLSGALPALISVEAGPGRAHLVWQGSDGDPTRYLIQRRVEGELWQTLTDSRLGVGGALVHEDRGVRPGARVSYRLAVQSGESLVSLEEALVEIPLPMPLTLRFARMEERGRMIRVSYILESHDRASLEVLDIAGRRVMIRDLGSPGAGEHELKFPSANLPVGVFFVRLQQHQQIRTSRLTLIR